MFSYDDCSQDLALCDYYDLTKIFDTFDGEKQIKLAQKYNTVVYHENISEVIKYLKAFDKKIRCDHCFPDEIELEFLLKEIPMCTVVRPKTYFDGSEYLDVELYFKGDDDDNYCRNFSDLMTWDIADELYEEYVTPYTKYNYEISISIGNKTYTDTLDLVNNSIGQIANKFKVELIKICNNQFEILFRGPKMTKCGTEVSGTFDSDTIKVTDSGATISIKLKEEK